MKKRAVTGVLGLVVAGLLAIGGTSATAVSAAPAPVLAVGSVGFSDVSICRFANDFGNRDCTEFYARTAWAFSVTNPSKTMTAVNVRARVLISTASGADLIDVIVPVAASIPPGQTVWAAPLGAQDFCTFYTDPNCWLTPPGISSADASGRGATAGVATIANVQWTKKRQPFIGTVEATVTTAQYSSCGAGSCAWVGLDGKEPSQLLTSTAVVKNSGKKASVWSVWVAFDVNGNPMGAVRLSSNRARGAKDILLNWLAPKSFTNRIARMVNVSVPR